MIQRVCILFLLGSFIGCATRPFGQITSLKTTPDEVIVIGRLKVLDKGKPITKETSLLFNEITWGTYAYRADTTGYIYTKLRKGKNYLARIGYEERFANIPEDYVTVTLSDATKVYYIGDITIDVTGKLHVQAGMMFGLVGALADAASKGKEIPIQVANNPDPSIEYFRKKFPNTIEVVNAPMVVHKDTTAAE